jgi:hypothetical protein
LSTIFLFVLLTLMWVLVCSVFSVAAVFLMLRAGFPGIDIPGLTNEPDRLLLLMVAASAVVALLQARRFAKAKPGACTSGQSGLPD